MTPTTATKRSLTIATMPLRRADYWVVAVSSMEQIIGTALSTVVGVMLPMLQMILHPEMSSLLQGLIGAMGLIGIGVGSLVIGRLSDDHGYLLWFRLCPVIIMLGSGISYFSTEPSWLMVGLFIIGVGVGGGYSLDSAYISELMPKKWRGTMVGVAKATCALGFIIGAAGCYVMLRLSPHASMWNKMILIIAAMGLITLLMRIRWAESPKWLMLHGRPKKAQESINLLLGEGVMIDTTAGQKSNAPQSTRWSQMFQGTNLLRVIFSGIPWACEGLGVYGFGVFLPVLIMALGLGGESAEGIHKIINSVLTTTEINFFILPGFILGLCLMNRMNHVRMLYIGFIASAIGLGILLVAYLLHLPAWVMIVGFLIFEVSLNGGPHLITFIIPSAIYPVEDRGAGTGIAAMLGKVGAVVGVILMPILLKSGGMTLVLTVSIAVMLAGALIGLVFGKILKLV